MSFLSRAVVAAAGLAALATPAAAERNRNQFYGQTTNQVLSQLRRNGNAYGAAHRDERSLMRHQFFGRRDDPGYRTTGNRIRGQQSQASQQVNAAVQELQRRMSNIADPRVRSSISRQISDVQRGMSRADSHTRATVPYLNAGGARYRPSW